MARIALYSSARKAGANTRPIRSGGRPAIKPQADAAAAPAAPPKFSWRNFYVRREKPIIVALFALIVFGGALLMPAHQRLTQRDIDLAVLHTLEKQPKPPSNASIAYEAIRPSVVHVKTYAHPDKKTDTKEGFKAPPPKREAAKPSTPTAPVPSTPSLEPPKLQLAIPELPKLEVPKFPSLPRLDGVPSAPNAEPPKPGDDPKIAKDKQEDDEEFKQDGSGTGVVIVEDGTILTSLHVVDGSAKITVTFADGSESDADVVSTQPQNDLAVIKAKTIPDDLVPATMRSTRGLRPGDEVVAVGFPFGIGPSASSGVVSGLGREYQSEEGKTLISNLIQFDAAANPGNSGGPLVDANGDVLGIVTAILNPTEERVFIGIGFAVPIENAAAGIGQNPF